MGIFDSIYGDFTCTHCGHGNMIEIQFKFANPFQKQYYIGDTISENPHTQTHLIMRGAYNRCEKCEIKLYPNAIVRRSKVIAIVNDQTLLSTSLDHFPDVPDGYFRDLKYENACQQAVGRAREETPFSIHPLSLGDHITALGHDWIIQKVFKRTIDPESPRKTLLSFLGAATRKRNEWFDYKVFHPVFKERWLTVSDSISCSIEVQMKPDHKEGYLYEEIL